MIRKVNLDDAAQIRDIYNHYVDHTIITFEENQVSIENMKDYIRETTANLPWYVFDENSEILGYAYASSWKSRCVYKYSLESTIYLRPDSFGKGIGSKLYKLLLDEIRKLGYRAVIGGISLPNPASVALHEKLGFEKIGQFKEVGYKFKKWIDVGYWELLFENEPKD